MIGCCSNHGHVHISAVFDQRLDRDDLRDLREQADEVWQRERYRDPLEAERDQDCDRESDVLR